MKKITFLMIAVCALCLAACNSAGDKASGNYNGNYLVNGTNYAGSITVTKVSDTKVNLFLVCNAPSMSGYANNTTISQNGDAISFSYTSNTTTDMEMVSVNGTLTGNTVVLNGVMYLTGGNGVGVFTGSK